MRIISQNGEVDLPYEMTALFAYDNRIEAVFSGSIQKSPYVMAIYENKEKCQKTMKMMNEVYTGCYTDENIKFTKMGETNIVFRFPEDDEI